MPKQGVHITSKPMMKRCVPPFVVAFPFYSATATRYTVVSSTRRGWYNAVKEEGPKKVQEGCQSRGGGQSVLSWI